MREYTDKISSFYRAHRRMPSYSEMAELFGYASKNAVYRLVGKLIASGFVAKDRLGRLVPSDTFGEIPLAGLVKAGPPSDVDELTDTINLDRFLAPKAESTYLLEVDGESMIEAHIADGDLVLVERRTVARDGEIVIARVDGEFTMKYLRETQGGRWLEPANKRFKPIYPKERLEIIGVVKAVIRKY